MRLDRFLANAGLGSRKACKKIIRKDVVTVDGKRITDGEFLIDGNSVVCVNGKEIPNAPFLTLMLHKPEGYMCSMIDENYPSCMNLIPDEYRKRVRMVGRLDQDTTGLLLMTDNGILNARLAHPKTKVPKKYYVTVNHILRPTLVELFDHEIDIGRGEIASPSKLEILDEYHAYLTVHEGKYHEVKRLFGHFNYDVVALERVAFGPLSLGDLPMGEFRLLTEEENDSLLEVAHMKKGEQL